jgi:hypothetical protein
MNLLELRKKSLAELLLASLALVMLPGCSSTEETPATDTGTDTGSLHEQDVESCKEACAFSPGHKQDECMAACDL